MFPWLLFFFSGGAAGAAKLRIGSDTPTSLRKGTSVITRVYFGTTQVWPSTTGVSGFDNGFDSGFGV